MNQEIRYKSYTANTTDRDSTDGELALSLNVGLEDGALTPLLPPKVLYDVEAMPVDWSDFENAYGDKWTSPWTLYNRKVVCVHQTSDYTHYIVACDHKLNGAPQAGKWLCWIDKASPTALHPCVKFDAGKVMKAGIIDALSSVVAVGNTLVALGTQKHYLLWKAADDTMTEAKANHYYYLGTQLPELDLSFGLQAEMVKGEESNPQFKGAPQDLATMFKYLPNDLLYGDGDSSVALNTQVLGQANKFIADNATNKGRFMYPFLVRYAYRLYDGSLTMHSSPVLMIPCSGANPQAIWNEDSRCAEFWRKENGEHVISALWYTMYGIVADLDYGMVNDSQRLNLLYWADIISSVDVFISAPIYTYNQAGTLKRFSAMDRYDIVGQVYMNDSHDESYGKNTFETRFNIINYAGSYPPPTTTDEGYNCWSAKWGDYNYWADSSTEEPFTVAKQIEMGSYYTDEVTRASFVNKITNNNGNKYYLKKTFTEMYRESWLADKQRWRNGDADFRTSEDAINRQYQSPTNLGRIVLPCFPEQTVLENIKECQNFYLLKSIDIVDLPTAGDTSRRKIEVPSDYLEALTNREVMTDDYDSHEEMTGTYAMSYNSRLHLANVKKKTFEGQSLQSMLPYANGGFALPAPDVNFYPATDDDATKVVAVPTTKVKLHTVIDINGERVVSNHGDSSAVIANAGVTYLYFPDTDAKKLELSFDGRWKTEAYTNHDFLSGSLFIADCIGGVSSGDNQKPAYTPTASRWYNLPNKLYVSDVGNPFLFPSSSINTIGTGEIIGLSTSAKALSQGQFGEFPLYAFCSDGVWALATTSTGGYSAKQPITRDVCINTKAILQIDSSVIFATNRGLMEISGSNTRCISDALFSQYPFTLDKMPGASQLVSLYNQLSTTEDQTALTKVTVVPFLSFLQSCQMLYDYTHQRIIAFCPGLSYAYVLSLKGGGWGMINASLNSSVLSYPDALAVDSQNRLVNFCEADSAQRTALLLTRPFKFGGPDVFKTIDTVIQRGCVEPRNVKQVLYGSNNLVDWFLVWSSGDIYMMGFRGTPYKFFRLAVVADLKANDKLDGVTVSLVPKQTNRLR